MNIIVTGGTGFIGSHLVNKLLTLNHNVYLLKHEKSDTWRINNIIGRLKIYNIETEMGNAFTDNPIDMVIHLSGKYLKYQISDKDIIDINFINLTQPTLLLENCIKHHVKYFINTGTFFEYEFQKKPISEDSLINPFNYYSASKLAFESILKFYVKKHNIKALTLKLFSPYGEKDNVKLIPSVIHALLNRRNLELSEGEQRLSFTYVEDIINAYIKSLIYIKSLNSSQYDFFNIGAEKAYSVKEVVNKIISIHKSGGDFIKFGALPYINNENIGATCDSEKAKKKLKWQDNWSIEVGLQRTYEYYKHYNDLKK